MTAQELTAVNFHREPLRSKDFAGCYAGFFFQLLSPWLGAGAPAAEWR